MSSEFGKVLRVSVFGQSHGTAIGVNIDGLPAGESVDMEELRRFLSRRRPGKDAFSTARQEPDAVRFLSGLEDGMTCGAPLCAIIENQDARSSDYKDFRDRPRPGHADYTAAIKYGGKADMRGGGHFSGRLTAPLCIAGGIAQQILNRRGIFVGIHLNCIGKEWDIPFPMEPTAALFREVAAKPFPVLDDACGERMKAVIADAAREGDSIGGIIGCATIGLPAGLGAPMFDGIENRMAAAIFGIPGVKGLEFGDGFAAASLRGSKNNDPYCIRDGRVQTTTNRCGGVLGGITNGMPLTFRVAMKPTPSIGKPQRTVSLSRMEPAELTITGRHDPCIAYRAVPVVEAVAATVLLDVLLEEHGNGTF